MQTCFIFHRKYGGLSLKNVSFTHHNNLSRSIQRGFYCQIGIYSESELQPPALTNFSATERLSKPRTEFCNSLHWKPAILRFPAPTQQWVSIQINIYWEPHCVGIRFKTQGHKSCDSAETSCQHHFTGADLSPWALVTLTGDMRRGVPFFALYVDFSKSFNFSLNW